MFTKQKSYSEVSLKVKLRKILMNMVWPLVISVVVAFVVLGFYTARYLQITHNVNVSSKFNLDFKENLDLEMYYYIIIPNSDRELPMQSVDEAIAIASSIKKTTKRAESQKSIQNVLDYCQNLKEKMYQIEKTENYDDRVKQLETNIYILTRLIQDEMMKYIYYEAGYLAVVEQQMIKSIIGVLIAICIFVVTVVAGMLSRSFRFANELTEPIRKLCDNVNLVGQGDFSLEPVTVDIYEIAHLNDGIERMAEQIQTLLEEVKREEQLQHKIELQLLQEQINPHFLYNTLDTIVWLIEADKRDGAVEMLANLSVFFRTTLSKGADVIPLKDELAHTRSYLDIQQVRYQDILDYELELPEGIGEVLLPKLTIQPLVENALYHGVKEKRGKSCIRVICAQEDDNIVIEVSDTGIGMKPERLKEIRESLESGERVGFGLSAVYGRLKLYFGEKCSLKITSEYGEGSCVRILIPQKEEIMEEP